MFYSWKPYVRVADRRKAAARAIARTFWGKAWCENLERYSDYSNRLPRGRTYVRNGSVVDLQISAGKVTARVAGSSVYKVQVTISAVPKAQWHALCSDCSGAIDSLVELLQGRLSKGVLERICRPESGLFPAPREIKFECSCPNWAGMCKHVAAGLYGIGSRLDEQPALLFQLRKVDEADLIARAGRGATLAKPTPKSGKLLDAKLAAELFNIELAGARPRRGRGGVGAKRR